MRAPRVRLVPAGPEHAELWHGWRSQSKARRHNPFRPAGVEDLRFRLACGGSDLRGEWASEYRWMLELERRIVGTVSLHNLNREMGHAEIGYMVCQTRQGEGIGAAGVRLLVRKAFKETRLRRLLAYCSVENAASWRLLESLGFRREGTLRGHYLIGGKPVSQHVYGLLRTDLR